MNLQNIRTRCWLLLTPFVLMFVKCIFELCFKDFAQNYRTIFFITSLIIFLWIITWTLIIMSHDSKESKRKWAEIFEKSEERFKKVDREDGYGIQKLTK